MSLSQGRYSRCALPLGLSCSTSISPTCLGRAFRALRASSDLPQRHRLSSPGHPAALSCDGRDGPAAPGGLDRRRLLRRRPGTAAAHRRGGVRRLRGRAAGDAHGGGAGGAAAAEAQLGGAGGLDEDLPERAGRKGWGVEWGRWMAAGVIGGEDGS